MKSFNGFIYSKQFNVRYLHNASLSYAVGDEYQFLQRSTIPTYHFQKSLRRLPIPKLELTCGRLLASAEAVLPPDRYAALKSVVQEFEKNEGQELHRKLVEYDLQNRHTSYISDPWFDLYLRDRRPCPINYNPFMMFAPDPEKSFNDQLTRATNFVVSFGRFKRSLDATILDPEVYHLDPMKSDTKFFRTVCRNLPSNLSWFGAVLFKAFPLDMSQYKNLFGGARIPQIGKDKLYHNPHSNAFIVIRDGKFYSVDLFHENGMIVSAEQIHSCLARILDNNEKINTDECIGSLTCLHRDKWAGIRIELCSDQRNAKCVESIDNSLFVLCLDRNEKKEPCKLIENFLVGGNGSNRWFDKCFQLIVDENGNSAINFEHSWGDGVAVLRLMEEAFRDANRNHFVSPHQHVYRLMDEDNGFQKLEFVLSESLRQQIDEAQSEHKNLKSSLNFGTAEYLDMSRVNIKRANLSPDAIMQLAFQLAFYKQYRQFVATYESCSTAAFLMGRTECMRPVTLCSRDAVMSFENGGTGLMEKLRMVSKKHTDLVKEASMGQGFDRHLLGMRVTAKRLGKKMPALFVNSDFEVLSHFIMSTSTLSTAAISLGGFGPVVNDGFGISYVVDDTRMGTVVSAYQGKRDAKMFANLVLESLDRIKLVMTEK